MDVSQEYIKMRIAAIPDLGMGDGDFALVSPFFVTDNVWVAPNGNFYCFYDGTIGCQLERQDQLQEIMNYLEPEDRNILDWFCFGVQAIYDDRDYGIDEEEKMLLKYYGQFTSMDQLWLAFVQKELHNKSWDGEKWRR